MKSFNANKVGCSETVTTNAEVATTGRSLDSQKGKRKRCWEGIQMKIQNTDVSPNEIEGEQEIYLRVSRAQDLHC